MPQATFDLPKSLLAALRDASVQEGRSRDAIVREALSSRLERPVHTIFQVSTSGALVAGVFDREVDVTTVLTHGDFGLGTFQDLDGELVILDGKAFQVLGSGEVREAATDAGTPFAVVTWFRPDIKASIPRVNSFGDLEKSCDRLRHSANVFCALRLEGRFDRVRTRAVDAMKPGSTLIDAANSQHEFVFEEVQGTLVGIWSPGFSSAFSVAGYHFHFLSDDLRHGGHVLDVAATELSLQLEVLSEFHLALPETASFLKADLSGNPSEALARAERAR